MRMSVRKFLDHAFTAGGYFAVALMTLFLLLVLVPIFVKGSGAYVFTGTVEHRRMMLGEFGRGNERKIAEEWAEVQRARQPIYEAMTAFEHELAGMTAARRKVLKPVFKAIREGVAVLLGPAPGEPLPALTRMMYGQTRWTQAKEKVSRRPGTIRMAMGKRFSCLGSHCLWALHWRLYFLFCGMRHVRSCGRD